MRLVGRWTQVAIIIGLATAGAACDQIDPARVCTSAETQRAIREIIAADVTAGAPVFGRVSVDPYGDRLVLEQVTLEAFDRTMNRIDCAGSFEGLNVRITYSRQPNHSEPGSYLYSVGDISTHEAGILLRTLSR